MVDTNPLAASTQFYCQEIEKKIESADIKLPVLPQAVQRILSMNSDSEFDVAELSALIHKDQTLAGHVLRISNSSVYAGVYRTSSLSQAISRLGKHAMVKIAVSVTMKGELFHVTGYESELSEIWQHSLASGMYAELIAKIMGAVDPEMYMCGLMHQVGKPVLLQTLVDLAKTHNQPLTHEQVVRVLDRYHTDVGYQLATRWKMPVSVTNACRFYANPGAAPEGHRAINITHIASGLADCLLKSVSTHSASQIDDENELHLLNGPIAAQIGLGKDEISSIQAQKDEIVEKVQALSV